MKTALLIIDPQNDFIDGYKNAALPVNGASVDMENLALYINENSKNITDIFVTLDSHLLNDIAHPMWYRDKNNQNPKPLTIITYKNIMDGTYTTTDPNNLEWTKKYLRTLEKNNKCELCVWPPHCLIGSEGQNIYKPVYDAIQKYSVDNNRQIHFIHKGMNPNTEHYSGLKAEVEIIGEDDTKLNQKLIDKLDSYDKIEISGEALSHCVANTTRDLVENIKSKNYEKITLLTDTMSNVTGFENLGENFLNDMKKLGLNSKNVKINKKHTLK